MTRNPDSHKSPARIRVTVDENPKRPGTTAHKLFKLYARCDTVDEYVAAARRRRGVRPYRARSSLRYDQRHGYIQIV